MKAPYRSPHAAGRAAADRRHSVDVAAPRDAVWDGVLATLAGLVAPAPARAAARLLGCDPPSASGWATGAVGSSIPGFRIVAVVGSGGHAVAVRRMLRSIARAAEATT